jgi:hypothetical protein
MLRYLRASKWVTRTAISRLEETLGWRRVQGLYDTLTPDYIEPEVGSSVVSHSMAQLTCVFPANYWEIGLIWIRYGQQTVVVYVSKSPEYRT